ncbi:MAG: diphosphomevalonate decarboxylase [Candidatus Aenigmarchaeota archaeon]|nr:diphosphomevalonate decarboxylase [Candidatus Aenigmarchaeota archaeon]
MKATAKANANIALIKYWGKRDEALILPYNSSISMTCDAMETITTVEFSENYDTDTAIINDEELSSDQKRVYDHIGMIRKMAGIKEKAKIVSESNFPLAAGLASSASGFAALTVAAVAAAGLKLPEKELSIIARQGSGSACRSILGGFVEWKKGSKSSDSYAEQIAGKDYWKDFRMIATIVKEGRKAISSRSGMSQTVKNSPYYSGWLSSIEEDLNRMREAIRSRDFASAGSIAEYNALKMHCTMMTSKPPIMYWKPATVEIMNAVMAWREDLESYFTMDAGPNVKVMCMKKDEKELCQRLSELEGVVKTISCAPGSGAALSQKHLFD